MKLPVSSIQIPDLHSLIDLFYDDEGELGKFDRVWKREADSLDDFGNLKGVDRIPEPYHQLLCHDAHMTVSVESFHNSLVDVEVLEFREATRNEPANALPGDSNRIEYCRKILLRRQSDRRVVQYGIVRLDGSRLKPEAFDEIRARQKPLGRVLIEHGVMRSVSLDAIWKVECGVELASFFQCSSGTATYGRTALISFDGIPGLELLEIVSPA